MRYLNPKADLTFKRVFGEHPDLVMSFLNALLPLQREEYITDIEYLPSEWCLIIPCVRTVLSMSAAKTIKAVISSWKCR